MCLDSKTIGELTTTLNEVLNENNLLKFENQKLRASLLSANKIISTKDDENRKCSAELNVAKVKAEQFLERSGCTFVSLDKSCNILLVNQTCLDILEYDNKDELIGRNWFDICIPLENSGREKLAYDQVYQGMKEGQDYYENEVITRTGKRKFIYWKVTFIKDENGQIKEILGSGIDITERKLAEEIIIKVKDEFIMLAESMPQIVWVTAPDGMGVYLNNHWVELTGLTLEESNGMGWFKALHPDDHDSILNSFQNALVTKSPNTYECRFRDKEGDYFWYLVRAVPIFDEKGDIIKWFGTCTDIQKNKETEAELIRAKEKAEEADRLKSAFLANMSHEIRTPLNGILGFSGLLQQSGLNGDKQQEYISIIEKSGVRMLNIINDIVDISKIETGLMLVNIHEMNVNQEIEFLQAFFKPQIEEKGLQFIINMTLPKEDVYFKSDREKFNSILTNLIKNAIKFTDEGTVELGYTLKKERESTLLEFYVKDSGIGIAENKHKVIFDRFIQADIADIMARQGAGLGLSISKAYAEMLGGDICVQSEIGKGSTFYFKLPFRLKEVEGAKSDKNSWPDKLNTDTNKCMSHLKILAVDDDPVAKLWIAAIVKKNCRAYLEAENGLQAVTICRNNPDIDIILLDLQMPVMNGYEAAQQIRQFNMDVVIIAQSAFGLSDEREKTIAVGCNDYISKPYRKHELLSLINKYVDK